MPTSSRLATSASSGWAAAIKAGTMVDPRPHPSRMTGSVYVQPGGRFGSLSRSRAWCRYKRMRDATIACCGGGRSLTSPIPAAADTARRAAVISGGAADPDWLMAISAPSAASASVAVTHCKTVGMRSSNAMLILHLLGAVLHACLPASCPSWRWATSVDPRVVTEQTGVVGHGAGVTRASVLVGRETELEQLLLALHRASAGTASCIFVAGEGGIGKTRLLAETAAAGRRHGLGVLTGRAPITTPVAFSVVAEALRSWLRGHPPPVTASPFDRGLGLVLPEWPRPSDGADLSPAQLRLLALEGIVGVVRHIAEANKGAMVLLDDLHAADPESLEAVRYLASAAVEGIAVIGALRSNEVALADDLVRSLHLDGVAEVIDVSALGERGVGELVAALLDADPPHGLVAEIVGRARTASPSSSRRFSTRTCGPGRSASATTVRHGGAAAQACPGRPASSSKPASNAWAAPSAR